MGFFWASTPSPAFATDAAASAIYNVSIFWQKSELEIHDSFTYSLY